MLNTKFDAYLRKDDELIYIGKIIDFKNCVDNKPMKIGQWKNGEDIYRMIIPIDGSMLEEMTYDETSYYKTNYKILNVKKIISGTLIGDLSENFYHYSCPVMVFIQDGFLCFTSFVQISASEESNELIIDYVSE